MNAKPTYTIVMDIFEHVEEPTNEMPELPKEPVQIDPIKELRNASGPIQIEYSARFQNSASKAFMDFKKSNERWLHLLITDLKTISLRNIADSKIMNSAATVRNRYRDAQSWQDIIDGLYADKVKGGRDFSEGQMKQLATLIGLLSQGVALAGCGSLQFIEKNTGKELV